MTPALDIDASRRILDRSDLLALHTDEPGELTCTYLTPSHRAVAAQLAQWMREAGFDSVRTDAVGNVVGRYRARADVLQPKCVATGSHYDTVRNAGKYDGRLGILIAIELVARLAAQDQRLSTDIEVVAFAEEEGVRFGSTFLGSSAYAGRFDATLLHARDAQGASMAEVMRQAGLDPSGIPAASADVQALAHYFEIHIEQGPVLLDLGLPVGVVSAIAGSVRRRLFLTGQASHAGTTPMAMRHDAACAAAEITLYVEERCGREADLVGTVGQLEVPGGSVNVVPGRCAMSLDVRAAEDAVRDAALADIDASIAAICERRGVACETEVLLEAGASACAPAYRAAWRRAIAQHDWPVHELLSGAGHDAMMMGRVTPMSMLFVRCGAGGISHNPLETVSEEDVAAALSVAWTFLMSPVQSDAGR